MSNVYNLINQLDSAVSGFEDKVNVHVRNVDTTTQRIQATTGQVYQKVQQFRDDLMKGEEKQIAHENIIRLDQVVKEQFGNYEEIRKTIIGVVRDFDINLVRNDTIEELSEELWSQVVSVSAPSVEALSCILGTGVEVSFGSPNNIESKEIVVQQLLAKYPNRITYINVRVPSNPSYRMLESESVQEGTGAVSEGTSTQG